MKLKVVGVAFVLLSSACAMKSEKNDTKLVPLTTEQASQDLEAVITNLKSLYGPMQFKEKRFGYKFSDLATAARKEMATSQTEEEKLAVIKRLLTKLKDGHIEQHLAANAANIESYVAPVFITPVEGHAIVMSVGPSATNFGVEIGDEVLTIDGKNPFDFLPTILKYETFSNDLSDQHFLYKALSRPMYIPELKPTSPQVYLTLKKSTGSTYSAVIPWGIRKYSTFVGKSSLF
jgi:hypothetical protein